MVKQKVRKLRLLCLHGMYQNADTFAAKTKHLRASKSPQQQQEMVEYIYLNGPFTVTPRILAKQNQHSTAPQHSKKHRDNSPTRSPRCAKQSEDLFRAWWRPSGPHQAEPTQLDEDRDVLLAFLRSQLAELGEVDGVLGFSQGASLASWLCSAQVLFPVFGFCPQVCDLVARTDASFLNRFSCRHDWNFGGARSLRSCSAATQVPSSIACNRAFSRTSTRFTCLAPTTMSSLPRKVSLWSTSLKTRRYVLLNHTYTHIQRVRGFICLCGEAYLFMSLSIGRLLRAKCSLRSTAKATSFQNATLPLRNTTPS